MHEYQSSDLDNAHAAIDRNDLKTLRKIMNRRFPAFVRKCFEYALLQDQTEIAYWFLEPENYRKGSALSIVVTDCGCRQSSLALWDAMMARFWPLSGNYWRGDRQAFRYVCSKLRMVHPNLLSVFLERGMIYGDEVADCVFRLIEHHDDLLESLTMITTNPILLKVVRERNHQRRLFDAVRSVARVVRYGQTSPWDVMEQLLLLAVDVHANEEEIFHLMITRGSGDQISKLASLIDQYQPDLLARNGEMLLGYRSDLFPFLHERCKGELYQIWQGSDMRCIVSQHPLEITPGCYFQLDHLHVYTRKKLITHMPSLVEGIPSKDLPRRLEPHYQWHRIDPLDETTTQHQATITMRTIEDGPLDVSFQVYIPDFLLPATIDRKPRAKSARSAYVD